MLSGRVLFSLLLVIYGALHCQQLLALPQEGTVIEGSASIHSEKEQLTVTAQDRSIIHWESFSIGSEEKVHFDLPSSHAAVLNRVVGEDPSSIFGQLHSNGAIYLINPHGLIIGQEGLIQAASFVASTLDLSNRDFLDGERLCFQGNSEASIENLGTIRATEGDVALLAQAVKNGGMIEALAGVIALGAGQEIVYLPHGDERIQIQLGPKKESIGERPGIHQAGALKGVHAELKADGNLYGYAIKNEGIIEATGIEDLGGYIYLVAEKGHTNHSGSLKGGEVHLLGDYVTLIDEARIDVSHPFGGGTVLIGGDLQGSNPHISHAQVTLVEKGVAIFADALQEGQGGKVIVWADDATGFYGSVSARGGEEGGNGGFVEVSAKNIFDFHGLVNTLAPRGTAGMLLLDPTDITISTAATDAGITFGGACGALTYCNTGLVSPRNINNSEIITNLGLGNVTINSTPGGPIGGNGDITFSAGSPFTWTGVNTNTFTLNARRNINFNADFTNSTSAGAAVFNAGLGILGTTTIAAGVTVSHSSAGKLIFDSNTVAGSDITINGALSVTGGSLTMTMVDDFTLAAITGSLTFNSPGNTFLFTTTAAAGSVATFNGPVTLNGNSTWTTSGTLNINDGLTTSGSGTLSLNSVGTITTGAASVINYGSSGNFSATVTGASNDIVLNGAFSATAANVTFFPDDDLTLAATTGSITYSAAGKTLTFLSGSSTAHTINGVINVTRGNLSMTSFDDIIIGATTGSITYNVPGGTCAFASTGGVDPDFFINGSLTIANGTFTANAFDDVVVGATGSFVHNSPNSSTLTGSGPDGDITITGAMTVTNGSITMNSTGTISAGAASTISWSSPGTWTMNATVADIALSGSTTVSNGNVVMTAATDIALVAGGTLTWSSPGSLSMTNTTAATTSTVALNGLTNFTNGSWTIDSQGTVSTGGASTTNYSAPGSFTILSRLSDITFNGPVNLNTAALFSANATLGDINVFSLVTNTSSGRITATAGDDFIVGDIAETVPSQIGSARGLTQITAGDLLTLHASNTTAGATALIGFTPAGGESDINITVGSSCRILAESSQNAGITSSGKVTMTVGGDLLMQGALITGFTGEAFISARNNLSVTAQNMTLLGLTGGPRAHIDTELGKLQLVANNNISLGDNTYAANFGSGSLILVVDQQAPFAPQVGLGAFTLNPTASLTTNGGDLSIFTATPSQNMIEGLINGSTLQQGNQIFGVYFSTSGIADPPPFTIFYKTPVAGNSFIQLGIASTQMIQQQLDRSIGWEWISPFFVCYQGVCDPELDPDFCPSREYTLFQRTPFEYPIFLPVEDCFSRAIEYPSRARGPKIVEGPRPSSEAGLFSWLRFWGRV